MEERIVGPPRFKFKSGSFLMIGKHYKESVNTFSDLPHPTVLYETRYVLDKDAVYTYLDWRWVMTGGSYDM